MACADESVRGNVHDRHGSRVYQWLWQQNCTADGTRGGLSFIDFPLTPLQHAVQMQLVPTLCGDEISGMAADTAHLLFRLAHRGRVGGHVLIYEAML